MKNIKQVKLKGLDPHIGYGYYSEEELHLEFNEEFKNGYIQIGESLKNTFKIGILGGSTSDISYDGSWLRPFYNICIESGINVTIFSGAVSGYSSSQEVIKLIRDISPLNPDLVISLNGVNDLGFIQSSQNTPFLHNYQKRIFDYILDKNNANYFSKSLGLNPDNGIPRFNNEEKIIGVNYGTRNSLSAATHWYKNIRMMHAISKSIGAYYLCFLQPIIGTGTYRTSDEELDLLINYRKPKENYFGKLVDFYNEAPLLTMNDDFICDISDCFCDMKNMFSDLRHPNIKGNKIIAKLIFDSCKKFLI